MITPEDIRRNNYGDDGDVAGYKMQQSTIAKESIIIVKNAL